MKVSSAAILFCLAIAGIPILGRAQDAVAPTPIPFPCAGWAYHSDTHYAYSQITQDWYFFPPQGGLWGCDLAHGQWHDFPAGVPGEWMFWAWPYCYRRADNSWWYLAGDTAVYNLSDGGWVQISGTTNAPATFYLLVSYKSRITNLISYGDTPYGRRVDIYFDGDLTGGLIQGRMTGIDYFLTRTDGISEVNARSTIATADGNISVQIYGYTFPDGSIKDTYVKFVTGASNYLWLNNLTVFGEGYTSNDVIEVRYYYYP